MPVATFSSGHVNMTKVGCFCCMYLKMLSYSLKIGFVKNDVSKRKGQHREKEWAI